MHAFVTTYRVEGTTPIEHAELCEQLAPAFAAVPGLVSETWLVNEGAGRFGAFYVFGDEASFHAFVASELFASLHARADVTELVTSDFRVEPAPTAITRGPSSEEVSR